LELSAARSPNFVAHLNPQSLFRLTVLTCEPFHRPQAYPYLYRRNSLSFQHDSALCTNDVKRTNFALFALPRRDSFRHPAAALMTQGGPGLGANDAPSLP
jgi:hypothetical protein